MASAVEHRAMMSFGQCPPILNVPREYCLCFCLVFGRSWHEAVSYGLMVVGHGEGVVGGRLGIFNHTVGVVGGYDGDVVVIVVGCHHVVRIEQHVAAKLDARVKLELVSSHIHMMLHPVKSLRKSRRRATETGQQLTGSMVE